MNKKIGFVAFLLFAYITLSKNLFAQSKTAMAIYNGQVAHAATSQVNDGQVTVNATGFSKSIADAKLNALQSAFYNVLFRGIPGSQYSAPLITDEASKINDPAVQELLDKGFNSFVTNSVIVEEDKKTRKVDGVKGYQCTLQITINVEGLRKHLEQKNVIRKFGF